MPSKNPTIQKAYKDGTITKGQYDKLPDALLLGIIKKKKGGTKKGEVRKTARKAYEPKKDCKCSAKKGAHKVCKCGDKGGSGGKKGGKGTKEERHKLGKQAHKAGRPKGGSKVRISK